MKITPIDAALGAYVDCGDLRRLDADARAELRQAWLDHIVLVFRGQTLDGPELLHASTIFGKTAIGNIKPKDNLYQEIAIVSNVVENGKPIGVLGAGEVIWHTDHSFDERPLGAAMLYAVEVPAAGGNTHFANMYAALDTLPAATRERVQHLTIKNDATFNSAGERRTNDVIDDITKSPGVSHPVIRTHGETGLDVLYLGRRPYAYVNGLPLDESEALLNELWAHCAQEQFCWAHQWKVGDLVLWDNRCAMHRRGHFDANDRRVMHRAQCEGERPARDPAAAARGRHPRAALLRRESALA